VPPLVVLIMGVTGSGKTTIGRLLAAELGWTFRDADEFHPAANIAKMSRGAPLDDADRTPWLAAIHAFIDQTLARGGRAVVTCSALKENYRRILVSDRAQVKLVHLAGDFALIHRRLRERSSHFMKPEMLPSQFATLEPPANALTIDIAQSPDAIVAEIRRKLNL
jgi:gluconokinase